MYPWGQSRKFPVPSTPRQWKEDAETRLPPFSAAAPATPPRTQALPELSGDASLLPHRPSCSRTRRAPALCQAPRDREHCHPPGARQGRGQAIRAAIVAGWGESATSSVFCWLYPGARRARGCLLGISPLHPAPDPSYPNLSPAFCIPLSLWKPVYPTDGGLLFFLPFLSTHLHPHLPGVSKLPSPIALAESFISFIALPTPMPGQHY